MEITEKKFEITLKQLLVKLKKLTYLSGSERHLESKAGFNINLDMNIDMGVKRNKKQVLITVTYKEEVIYVAGTLDPLAQTKILDWFYYVRENIINKEELLKEKNESEGIELFKKI